MILPGNWFTYTALSLLLYGVWGFLSKLATNYIDPKTTLFYDILGGILVGVVLAINTPIQLQNDIRGILYAILIGIAGTTATLFFFIAVSKSSVSVVLPLTSLYPGITVILAFLILKEPISLRQGIGILMAVVALVLLCI